MSLKDDIQYMSDALDLAKAQIGKTGKNPAVGCVIVSADGAKIAEGFTSDGGAEHAEQAAIARLTEGEARGATAYVTLEPCRERSKGGFSCSELLLEVGIARLVCPLADQHPNGSGGFARLFQAGVAVEIGLMKEEATLLYKDFFSKL